MKRIETGEAFGQNLRVVQAETRPTFEKQIETAALRALEFSVLEIRVVNHFANAVRCGVGDREAFQ
jgi:hypothetical protein